MTVPVGEQQKPHHPAKSRGRGGAQGLGTRSHGVDRPCPWHGRRVAEAGGLRGCKWAGFSSKGAFNPKGTPRMPSIPSTSQLHLAELPAPPWGTATLNPQPPNPWVRPTHRRARRRRRRALCPLRHRAGQRPPEEPGGPVFHLQRQQSHRQAPWQEDHPLHLNLGVKSWEKPSRMEIPGSPALASAFARLNLTSRSHCSISEPVPTSSAGIPWKRGRH